MCARVCTDDTLSQPIRVLPTSDCCSFASLPQRRPINDDIYMQQVGGAASSLCRGRRAPSSCEPPEGEQPRYAPEPSPRRLSQDLHAGHPRRVSEKEEEEEESARRPPMNDNNDHHHPRLGQDHSSFIGAVVHHPLGKNKAGCGPSQEQSPAHFLSLAMYRSGFLLWSPCDPIRS